MICQCVSGPRFFIFTLHHHQVCPHRDPRPDFVLWPGPPSPSQSVCVPVRAHDRINLNRRGNGKEFLYKKRSRGRHENEPAMPVVSRSQSSQAADLLKAAEKPKELAEVTNASSKSKKTLTATKPTKIVESEKPISKRDTVKSAKNLSTNENVPANDTAEPTPIQSTGFFPFSPNGSGQP
jgi:hypothetical protein